MVSLHIYKHGYILKDNKIKYCKNQYFAKLQNTILVGMLNDTITLGKYLVVPIK